MFSRHTLNYAAVPLLFAALIFAGCSGGSLPKPQQGGGGGEQPAGPWQRPDVSASQPQSAARLFSPDFGTGAGGNPPVPSATTDAIVYVVRDGDARNIAIMPPDGSFSTKLTNDQCNNSSPAISPDGRFVLYTARRNGGAIKIFVMNIDGTGARRVTNDPDDIWETSPSWSPDGTKIAYVRAVPAGQYDFDLQLAIVGSGVNAAQARPTTIPLAGFEVVNAPDWLSNNRLVFAGTTNQDPASRLYAVNIDGSGLTKLTDAYEGVPAENQGDGAPAASPDGSQIFFERTFMRGNDEFTRIMAMNADGSNVHALVSVDGGSATAPHVSPDGSRLVFTCRLNNAQEIWIKSLPDGQPHRVREGAWGSMGRVAAIPRRDVPHRDTCTAAPNTTPATPPPTGRLLWLDAHRGDQYWDLETIKPDGADRFRWPPDPCLILAARWMPDGQRIAFISCRPGTSADVYIARADGTQPRRLTQQAITQDVLAPSLAVSPDGRRICYTRVHGSQVWLHVVNADGTGDHAVTQGPYDTMPDFSPDGSTIVFTRVTSPDPGAGVSHLWVMNADGSGAHQITHRNDASDGYPRWHPSGAFIMFTRLAYESGSGPYANLWACTPDGSAEVQVTAAHFFVRAAVFNGDGTKIAYQCEDQAGRFQVIVHDLVTNDGRPVMATSYDQRLPDWWDPGAGTNQINIQQLPLLTLPQ